MASPDPKAVWADSVDHEVSYWDRTIGKNVGAFQWRYRRPKPANDLLPGLVDLVPDDKATILDVGCGPAPVVIGTYSKPVDITACDPLADLYNSLLEKHGVNPSVVLTACEGEQLASTFGENGFDIVHIQNALDHSYDPVEVVRNMLRCAKPGGIVVIKTLIETGKYEDYHGLHQWDILPGASDFYIRHRSGETTAMASELGADVSLLLAGVHVSGSGSSAQEWLNLAIVKRGGTLEGAEEAARLKEIEAHFFRTLVALGRALADQASPALGAEQEKLEKQVEDLKAREAALRGSTSFQLGRAFAEARSPGKLLALPGRVISIARSGGRTTA
ncbi:class I SAM-dependent methyltransferase [Flindersiella endophytica]